MTIKRKILGIVLALMAWAFSTQISSAFAAVAPDATGVGPLAVTSAEYRFPATVDPDIIGDRATELWARVYRPEDLSEGPPRPVLVFLHGNHATCGIPFGDIRLDDRIDYTLTGVCPPEYVVVPNHLGYGYLAERLASWGYIVVSINANRGITAGPGVPGDAGLNLARGRLVLKHIQGLSEWNSGISPTPESLEVDLRGKLDFSSVGLMGHSRGGEGVRAAYNFYRDPGSPWPDRIPNRVVFQGIFEIAPVDGQTSRVLNANGTTWNVLLPMCDGDVSNLQGVRPFDRMLRIFRENPATQKSTYTVWGANHNFYNTEWMVSDSAGCFFHPALFPFTSGSESQRQTGLASVLAFFRGNIGQSADRTFNQNFDPQFELPSVVTSVTRVDRGYTPTPNTAFTTVFEDFERPTGTNTYGFPNEASNITIVHGLVPRHDPIQRAGIISWTTPGSETYFQTNWEEGGRGRDASGNYSLDLRVSRRLAPSLNPDPNIPTDFSIQLVMADGSLSSSLKLSTYLARGNQDLRGPVGGAFAGNLHPILQTVRIPLTEFANANLNQVRGVRLTFDETPTGAIYVANIRLSATSTQPPIGFLAGLLEGSSGGESLLLGITTAQVNNMNANHEARIVRIMRGGNSAAVGQNSAGEVEIEVVSEQPFPVRNELVSLRIGEQSFVLSRYPDDGDTSRLIFSLSEEEFEEIPNGAAVFVEYGPDAGADSRWNAGQLDEETRNRL